MIETIANRIEAKKQDINDYVSDQLQDVGPTIYSSFDIRNSGHKIAAVDPNVFPAGFNNVCQESLKAAAPVLEQIIRKRFGGGVETIGIYTEDHTKNTYYLQNLHSLIELFRDTGFESLLVTTNEDLDRDPRELETAMGDSVELHQLNPEGSKVYARGLSLDLVISNNDFSTGVHPVLQDVPVPVTPPPEMGWWNRKKINHFEHQQTIMKEISEILGIDPWYFIPSTRSIDNVDFERKGGFDEVAQAIDEILRETRKKYEELGIDETPTAFVKSNSGTYGMGVYHFDSGEEFLSINRDTRDSMDRRKGGGKNDSVIVQEGIRTVDRLKSMNGELVAEPVIYCLEHRPVGGFLRTNEEQSDRDNLNTRGMNFSSEDLCTLFVDDADKNVGSNITGDKIEVYKLIATLGSLACARELADMKTKTQPVQTVS